MSSNDQQQDALDRLRSAQADVMDEPELTVDTLNAYDAALAEAREAGVEEADLGWSEDLTYEAGLTVDQRINEQDYTQRLEHGRGIER